MFNVTAIKRSAWGILGAALLSASAFAADLQPFEVQTNSQGEVLGVPVNTPKGGMTRLPTTTSKTFVLTSGTQIVGLPATGNYLVCPFSLQADPCGATPTQNTEVLDGTSAWTLNPGILKVGPISGSIVWDRFYATAYDVSGTGLAPKYYKKP